MFINKLKTFMVLWDWNYTHRMENLNAFFSTCLIVTGLKANLKFADGTLISCAAARHISTDCTNAVTTNILSSTWTSGMTWLQTFYRRLHVLFDALVRTSACVIWLDINYPYSSDCSMDSRCLLVNPGLSFTCQTTSL